MSLGEAPLERPMDAPPRQVRPYALACREEARDFDRAPDEILSSGRCHPGGVSLKPSPRPLGHPECRPKFSAVHGAGPREFSTASTDMHRFFCVV
jgi:hypothetical protein